MLAVEVVARLRGPVGLRLQQADRVFHALAVALLEAVENQIAGVDVPRVDHVVEPILVRRELLHVAGEEIAVLRVEEFQVPLEYLAREGIVDGRAAVMGLFQDAPDLSGDGPLVIGRYQRARGKNRGGPGGGAQGGIRRGEQEDTQGGEG
jgi:hypothetical protein